MCVPDIDYTIIIVICIPVVLKAIAVKVTGPDELVDSGVIIIVFVVGPFS